MWKKMELYRVSPQPKTDKNILAYIKSSKIFTGKQRQNGKQKYVK
jgi:hypothetical protein